ncbi:hypothetical protein [Streptomyces longwoodensis]|uniref:hypothetical protein n=1 Tax=Streptomyces longwoodensis TaxID=68231 RepID=UPI003403B79F
MSTPAVVRWAMPGPFTAPDGRVIACPQCQATERLVVGMDLDDVDSPEPSWLSCPAGHAWPEAGLPRGTAALILAEVLDAEPGLLASLDELRREYGA